MNQHSSGVNGAGASFVVKKHPRDRLRLIALAILLGTTATASAQAQSGAQSAPSNNERNYILPGGIPGVFERHARSLGPRITTPGSERIVMTGELARGAQKSSMTAIYELPGKVRIQYGTDNRTAAFDGTDSKGAADVNDDDEALLEALAYDVPETFLLNLQDARQSRILGFRFLVHGETGFGSYVDIYEMTQTVKTGAQSTQIVKRFQFDSSSSSGLFRRVSYYRWRAAVLTRVHTEFSQYVRVGGNPLPHRMVRIQNGQVVYDVTWAAIQVGRNKMITLLMDTS